MTKYVLLLMLTGCGRPNDVVEPMPPRSTIDIDARLDAHVKEWLQDAETRTVDLQRWDLGTDIAIEIPDAEKPTVVGMCFYDEDSWHISIHPDMLTAPDIILKATVYHELFHCVGYLDHDEREPHGLMNSKVLISQPAYYENNWVSLVDREFARMKQSPLIMAATVHD